MQTIEPRRRTENGAPLEPAVDPFLVQNYSRYAYGRFRRSRKYILGSWSRWFKKTYHTRGKLVLDFGSGGSGEGSAIMRQFREQNGNVSGYRAYDACEGIKTWLLERGCFYEFYEDDSLRGQFDMIIGNQIYEHLDSSERLRFVGRSTELLKEGGLLVLTYPFNLYNMNFRYFWEDITHKPVGVEAEASLIALFGYHTQIYLGGLKGSPFPLWENILCLLRNLALLYPPFWLVNICARKDSGLLRERR